MKKSLLYSAVGSTALFAVALAGSYMFYPNLLNSQEQEVMAQVDTSEAIKQAQWTDNVTITMNEDDNTFRYESDGLPAYGMADGYLVPDDPSTMPFNDDPPESFWTLELADIPDTPIDETITTLPKYSNEVTETSLGQIGVAINGAQIFNDYEDMERTIVALNDNVIHDHAAFVDECNGHPLGDGSSYHYHGVPVCISEVINVEGEHSYMIGVLKDGFPVYTDQGENGILMTNDDLDECGGHFGPTPEFPDGIYHYHMTADETPYSMDCYHGEVEIAQRGGGGGPDLTNAAAQLGISIDELRAALGDSGPPNFEQAAETLGISVDVLMSVMPARPN